MRVKLKYFASFKDYTSLSDEDFETTAVDINTLFDNLHTKYSFKISKRDTLVAVNKYYENFDYKLNDGDEIAFIPPVAGG